MKIIWTAVAIAVTLSAFAQQEQPKGPEQPGASVAELVSRLSYPDWRARESAQKELLARGAEVLEEVRVALEDENFEVRYRAKQVFDAVEARAQAGKLLGYLLGEEEAAGALEEIQKKIKRPMARLVSPKAGVRAALAGELGGSGLESAAPLVVHLLGDKDNAVQSAAQRALDGFDSKAAQKYLLAAARKGELVLRCRALLALGRVKEPEAAGEVAKYLDSEVIYLRLAAVESLDAMRDRKAAEHLVKAFKDEYERVRWNAVDAFTRVKCKAAVEPLIEALEKDTARIMEEDELKELKRVLVPAGFRILTSEEARMKVYLPKALQYQTGQAIGADPDKWREWWEKNKDSFSRDEKPGNAATREEK